jgi:hypothetical protein
MIGPKTRDFEPPQPSCSAFVPSVVSLPQAPGDNLRVSPPRPPEVSPQWTRNTALRASKNTSSLPS